MPDITTVFSLRQSVEAMQDGNLLCIDKSTLRAMLTALEAAEEAEPWMDFIYANSLLGADDLEPLKVDGLRLSNALAPLFPKEEDDE
jgi:hypothetical protein